MLVNNMDQQKDVFDVSDENQNNSPRHENIRGQVYYDNNVEDVLH